MISLSEKRNDSHQVSMLALSTIGTTGTYSPLENWKIPGTKDHVLSFQLLGIAILSVGIWSRIDGSWISPVGDHVIENAANMMIASGIIVIIIGFLGCCGAVRKSQCMLISVRVCCLLLMDSR